MTEKYTLEIKKGNLRIYDKQGELSGIFSPEEVGDALKFCEKIKSYRTTTIIGKDIGAMVLGNHLGNGEVIVPKAKTKYVLKQNDRK